ncbi:hypothetical protein JOF53_008048 [Crossiella equi]|uniref:LamG domain-containing protein n=1 Tax=Crossiella equi TaxID=130796 RepID=A0ABS5ARJ0_9PSEU|nr:hypothetical protein [Crossiella equi]MBP2479176.1 hypothetical protein [Crossiella equi]
MRKWPYLLAAATLLLTSGTAGAAPRHLEPFDRLDPALWKCEYTCPTIEDGVARFTLQPGIGPNKPGSWSKISYKPTRFTSGTFTTRFSLSARPKQKVWWGVALWDDGPTPTEFNEINFGYTTDGSLTNTQLYFESAKRGEVASIKVDTGVNLYDNKYHVATLQYDANAVRLYFDGKLLRTITDRSVIPTDPMAYLLGPRLVTGSAALPSAFTQSVGETSFG